MFTWNSSKTAITAASAGLFGMGAIFYFYYYNDDSRISSKKLRPIEILYHEHENFATLRKNWQITMNNLVGDAERLIKLNKVTEGVRCITTAAALVALVQNEKQAMYLLNSVIPLPTFNDHELMIRNEFKEDMDAVQLIIQGEMADISSSTLKELQETSDRQTGGS